MAGNRLWTISLVLACLSGCAHLSDGERAAARLGLDWPKATRASARTLDDAIVRAQAPSPPIPDGSLPGEAPAETNEATEVAAVVAADDAQARAEQRGARVGLSSIARNRALYDETPYQRQPRLDEDPLDGSDVPLAERDPFLAPWLINLINQDRWRLDDDPERARRDRLRRRAKIDIRDPDPDTANFPNGAYTLPKGRAYIETSPVGFYGPSKTAGASYNWEYLARYGLTDNLEFRLFSNGFAVAPTSRGRTTSGVGPLAFDFKYHFWEENPDYFVPAMGAEIYVQTTFGSPAFNDGTQPSINLLFDQSLPFDVGLEYNIGITGTQDLQGASLYQLSFQWSFQRQVVKDFDVFFHGFYNHAALPSLETLRSASAIEQSKALVMGLGGIWTVNDRVAIFGSYNLGFTPSSPSHIILTGFAYAF